jgi:predicted nucleic acid-binding protein
LKRDSNVLYLDANVFIFAALSTHDYGSKAESLLDRIQRGEEKAITSALTFDEVFWEVKRNRGLEKALETSEALLYYPNLEIIAADREIVLSAIQIIKKYNLAPRDALHAATAIKAKVDYMVTTDKDFRKVKELKIQTL